MLVGPALGQVNLPEGFEIVEFAVTDTRTSRPAINNCGEIVYVKDRFEDSRVYLYDNGKITRLTDHNKGLGVGLPDINDEGTIVWYQAMRRTPESAEIVMLRNGKQSILGSGSTGSINSFGEMSWQLFRSIDCNVHYDIMFYDGVSATRIFRSEWTDQSPEINADDWIVWSHADFCVSPWIGDIMLYSDGKVTQLTDGTGQYVDHAINNRGQVAWMLKHEIYLWENGEIRKVISGRPCGGPRINEFGDIFFWRWYSETETFDAWLYYISDGEPTFHRLTEDPLDDGIGNINDWTEAAWRFRQGLGNSSGGVRFLRRVRTGDAEFDEDIDLSDYALFADCMTGPGPVDRLCDCRFLDIDYDGDVDLADFARFQNGFTGK